MNLKRIGAAVQWVWIVTVVLLSLASTAMTVVGGLAQRYSGSYEVGRALDMTQLTVVLLAMIIFAPVLLVAAALIEGLRPRARRMVLSGVAVLVAVTLAQAYPVAQRKARADAEACRLDQRLAARQTLQQCLDGRRRDRIGPWRAWGNTED